MVGGLFGEDQGEVGEFRGESLFRFCLFSDCSKLSSGGDFGYLLFQREIFVKEARSTSDDSMEGLVGVCAD